MLSAQRVVTAWDRFVRTTFDHLVTNEHGNAVAPRQKEWHDAGEHLKYLKRRLPPAIYQSTVPVPLPNFKRYFHQLGELLKRHPWAIDKRARKRELEAFLNSIPLHLRFQNLPWRLGNGAIASR